MKFDLHIVINVLIALAIFYVLDKMVLESRVADKLPKL